MAITKINTSELLDFPNDSISNKNTSGTIIPVGYTNACNFPTASSVEGTALYEFNDTVNDTCGNYNGTQSSNPVTFTTGAKPGFDKAGEFNGTDQYVVLPNSIETDYLATGQFAISVWINTNALPASSSYTNDLFICSFYENSYLNLRLVYDGVIQGEVAEASTGTGRICVTPTSTITTGTWYHIVFTGEKDNMKLYVNGTLEGIDTSWNGTFYSASNAGCSIGSRNAGTDRWWNGEIDQFRLYSAYLNSSQVTELYNETGTEAYRPTTNLSIGEFRFNKSVNRLEYYNGTNWYQTENAYITGQPTTCLCSYPNSTNVALYTFQNNTEDTCGNYNGTAYNLEPYTASGKYRKAAVFNGTNSYVQITNLFNFSKDFSISMWVNPDTVVPQWQGIFGTDGYGSATHDGFLFYMNYAVLEPWVAGPSGSGDIFQTGSLSTGTWQHIVLTRAYNDKWELYLDGTLLGTNTSLALTWDLTPQVYTDIGRHPTSLTYYFDGNMDQIRVFNSALTQTQVTELYNEIACN